MGKAALLYVGAAIMMMTGLYGAITRTGVETDSVQADYESQVVAREIAQSAFNMMLQGVRENYAAHRPDRRYQDYRDGEFSYRALGTSNGPVYLEAVGDVLQARHRVRGTLEMFRRSPLAALTFDGPLNGVVSHGTSWLVTGDDDSTPSLALSGTPTRGHGVRSVLEQADAIARDDMPGAQVTGIAGTSDFVQNPGIVTFSDIIDIVDAMPAASKTIFNGDQSWTGSRTFGSAATPAVVVVNGDLRIAGNVNGWGILVVKGALDIRQNGTPIWEGLFIVESTGTEHKIQGNAQIWGAMALVATTVDGETGGEEDAGLAGGHFDVSVFDGSGNAIYQAHQYDDRYNVSSVDVLRAGCRQGGLCWNEIIADAGVSDVIVEVLGDPDHVSTNVTLGTSVPVGSISSLRVSGFGLCDLPGARPGDVKADRSAAQTVRVKDADTGNVVYEVAVYHHLTGHSCSYENTPGQYFEAVQPMDLLLAGNARINMSSVALGRLYGLIPVVQATDPEYVLRDVREQHESTNTQLFEEFNENDSSQDTRDFFW